MLSGEAGNSNCVVFGLEPAGVRTHDLPHEWSTQNITPPMRWRNIRYLLFYLLVDIRSRRFNLSVTTLARVCEINKERLKKVTERSIF